jgi:hypothetical protein
MVNERAVVLDVSRTLYAAAERLPSGSPWIAAFCEIAQLIEGDAGPEALSASERLRRRGIQARARVTPLEAASTDSGRAPESDLATSVALRAVPTH